MVRLADLDPPMREAILALDCPTFETVPWCEGPPLGKRRLAIVTTAGLHRATDPAFAVGAADYRVIPSNLPAAALRLSHVSTNFDRSGFQEDINVIFPADRVAELARDGIIASVATYHYAFMGATDPRRMEPEARALGRLLRDDGVDAVILTGV